MRAPALLVLLLFDLLVAVLAVVGVGYGAKAYLHDELRYGFVETTLVCDVIVLTTVLASYATGLHTRVVLSSPRQRWVRSFVVGAGASLAAITVSYLVWYQTIGRIVFVATGAAIGIGLWGVRAAFAGLIRRSPRERVLILGPDEPAAGFARALGELSDSRCEVAGVLPMGPGPGQGPDEGELLATCRGREVDRLAVLPGPGTTLPTVEIIDELAAMGVRTQSAATLWMEETGRVPPELIDAAWLLAAIDRRAQPGRVQMRRLMDLFWASLGFVAFVVALPLVWLVHRLEGGGPLFFVQSRVGLGGRSFRMIKFRTMRPQADEAAQFAAIGDPRITTLGRLLRRHRIDELPQVLNVLRGEMSIVGPRPEQPAIAARLGAEIPAYDRRHLLAPGLTGWAQIHHGYADSVESSKLKLGYDLYYVAHHGLLLDLDIIARTFYVLVARIGAR